MKLFQMIMGSKRIMESIKSFIEYSILILFYKHNNG